MHTTSTPESRFDYNRLRQAFSEVSHAFSIVSDTCIASGTPMETATALRSAADALVKAADEFELINPAGT